MPHRDSASGFRLMALSYKVRDTLKPRSAYLEEAGIREGMQVLDFGCGPGSYVVPAAQMVGNSGTVYALDVQQTALTMTRERAAKMGLSNVETILSDRDTGLPDGSIDVALLYDIYHDLPYPTTILTELHRVLKPSGILSTHDHHLKSAVLKQSIESSGLFRMTGAGKLTLTFTPKRRPS